MAIEDAPLVNKVAQSSLITLNMEQWYPSAAFKHLDLKDYLFQGLILKEKDFRLALKEMDWTPFHDKIILCYCSADAIIPVWAYALVASYVSAFANDIYIGNETAYLESYYHQYITALDCSEYEGAKIVIKGCSNKAVPPNAYAVLTAKLANFASSIMYGEPCSTVPIYKKAKKG